MVMLGSKVEQVEGRLGSMRMMIMRVMMMLMMMIRWRKCWGQPISIFNFNSISPFKVEGRLGEIQESWQEQANLLTSMLARVESEVRQVVVTKKSRSQVQPS